VKGALGRKFVGLPLWAWGAVVLVLGAGYYIYRRRASSTSGTSGAGTSNEPAGSDYVPSSSPVDAAQAGQPSTNSAPGASLSPDVLTSLLGPDSALVTALDQLVGAQPAPEYNPPPPSTGGVTPVPITISVATPGATHGLVPTTTAAAHPASPAKPAIKSAPAKVTYFTYKKDVKLKSGQTLGYTAGKGYYAK
jgi:hypothetical protein